MGGGGGTGIGFIDNTIEKVENESKKSKIGRAALMGLEPSSQLIGPALIKHKNRPKAQGNTQEVAAYNSLIASLQNNSNLTDEQREGFLTRAEGLYGQNFNAGSAFAFQHRGGLRDGVSALQKEIGDIGRDVSSRQAYTKAQSDAITGGVNAKLMQTQIASFLGATAVKKAM